MASSADASQLGGSSSADASDGTVCVFRIGSFNVGVNQSMLTGKNCYGYVKRIKSIITTCVVDSALDIMNLCEVGGHKQGLFAAGIHPGDMQILEGTDAPFR